MLVNLLALSKLDTVFRVAAARAWLQSACLVVLHFRGMRRSTPWATTFSTVSELGKKSVFTGHCDKEEEEGGLGKEEEEKVAAKPRGGGGGGSAPAQIYAENFLSRLHHARKCTQIYAGTRRHTEELQHGREVCERDRDFCAMCMCFADVC